MPIARRRAAQPPRRWNIADLLARSFQLLALRQAAVATGPAENEFGRQVESDGRFAISSAAEPTPHPQVIDLASAPNRGALPVTGPRMDKAAYDGSRAM